MEIHMSVKLDDDNPQPLLDCLNALMVVAVGAYTMGSLNDDPKAFEQVKDALVKAGWGSKLESALNR